jgi:glucan biosynthesis protein C
MASPTTPVKSARRSPLPAEPAPQPRLAFVDNLRILLVILVILHHLAVTYGGEGPWHYYEGGADAITAMILTLFVVVNQAFFMGFYFLIAAYFLPRSLERHPIGEFLKGRFLRLGVPLVFQLLVVGPLLSYGLGITVWGFEGSVWAYLGLYWRKYRAPDTGPLWFVEALLIFSLIYALWWGLARPPARGARSEGAAPGNWAIAIFALVLGLVTFVVRIWLPVGWYFPPLNLQFPTFPSTSASSYSAQSPTGAAGSWPSLGTLPGAGCGAGWLPS